MNHLNQAMAALPLVAILRGIAPKDAAALGHVLYEAGFRIIEVPLNSPQPTQSIKILRDTLPKDAVIGAGTVLDVASVKAVADVGGELIVMPHADTTVIRAAKERNLFCVPGVATPTEAFAALAAGADALKAFPAEMLTPPIIKAWRAVLPPVAILPVGGIAPETMERFVAAGAAGFGLGSALYKPGAKPADVAATAKAFVDAWRAIKR
jgi:2-dehydro-3-deoxyphosphogalactonate aldolase